MAKIWNSILFLLIAPGLMLAACNPDFGPPPILPTSSGPNRDATQVESAVKTLRANVPLAGAPAESTPTAAATASLADVTFCSPLPGYDLEQLKTAIVNPYAPPPFGSDDPHQGIDLADIQFNIAAKGHEVDALLPGIVAGIVNNRFPYGNAIIIETPLNVLPADMQAQLQQIAQTYPTPAATTLTCPPAEIPWQVNGAQSLFLLYAHMEKHPTLTMGDRVGCGTPLGAIGQTGNAKNPHLHLEARLGPVGATIGSMAHYEPYVSEREMSYYCEWRVKGSFKLIDPLLILQGLQNK